MKNQKGITMTSLIIYIVLLLIVIVMLGVMRNNFENGVMEMSSDSKIESEFNRFNLYFLKDVKNPGSNVELDGNNKVTFNSGNIYEFDSQKGVIYFKSNNQNLKLLENINSCTFTINNETGKTVVNVSIEFKDRMGNPISKQYVLTEATSNDLYQDEEEYVNILIPYKKIEYIESTGTQYIDTGIIPSNHTFKVDFQFTQSSDGAVFGTWNAWEAPGYYFINYAGKWCYQCGTQQVYGQTSDTNRHNIIFNNAENKLVFDNSTTNLSTGTVNGINDTCIIFAFVVTENVETYANGLKIYSFKIYDKSNNSLVRDFIPVLDPNNVACLYDKVSEEYFYNQGTGDFVAGPEI